MMEFLDVGEMHDGMTGMGKRRDDVRKILAFC